MHTIKLMAVGTSTGVIIPKEMLARLNVEKGDFLYAIETPDGFKIVPYDPVFGEQMDAARKIMKKRRNVLRELAK